MRTDLPPTRRLRPEAAGASRDVGVPAGLASLGQRANAFRHAELSLARGLLDDLSGLGRAESKRGAELRARLGNLEPTLASLSTTPA